MNVDRWVNSRMSVLEDASGWQPDDGRARARLRELDRTAKRNRRWAWASAAAACLALLVVVQPNACANPRGCVKSPESNAPQSVHTSPAVTAPAPAASSKNLATKPQAAAPIVHPVRNFKESGSPQARITCEIYSDYECPYCAVFDLNTLPSLVADYVQTGKVKLIHRDYPLQQHPHSKIAARYANAAGEAGLYEPVTAQLFKTQEIWSKNGDIEAQIASILSRADLQKLHSFLDHDPHLDDTVAADQAMAVSDQINATPSLVVVFKGKRQLLPATMQYRLLKSYLDDLLSRP